MCGNRALDWAQPTNCPCIQKHGTIILDKIHIATTNTAYNRNYYKIHNAGICTLYKTNNNTPPNSY
jgi:hypothetical protein